MHPLHLPATGNGGLHLLVDLSWGCTCFWGWIDVLLAASLVASCFLGPSLINHQASSDGLIALVPDMPVPLQAVQGSAATAQAKLDELRVKAAEELGAARADAEAARSQQQELQVGSPFT